MKICEEIIFFALVKGCTLVSKVSLCHALGNRLPYESEKSGHYKYETG